MILEYPSFFLQYSCSSKNDSIVHDLDTRHRKPTKNYCSHSFNLFSCSYNITVHSIYFIMSIQYVTRMLSKILICIWENEIIFLLLCWIWFLKLHEYLSLPFPRHPLPHHTLYYSCSLSMVNILAESLTLVRAGGINKNVEKKEEISLKIKKK